MEKCFGKIQDEGSALLKDGGKKPDLQDQEEWAGLAGKAGQPAI